MIKNIHFSLLVSINHRLHEFNFRKRSDSLYDGDTGDERGNRYYFKIVSEKNNWQIEGKDLPAWITQHKNLVTDAFLIKATQYATAV